MEIASEWKDYEILDMCDGEKLERWGNIILIRPDPQIIWKEKNFPEKWKKKWIYERFPITKEFLKAMNNYWF